MTRKQIILSTLLVLVATFPSFGQEVTRKMYKWVADDNSEKDRIFDYAYLTLYLKDGKVTGGVLNATTDEYDVLREGYVCGYSIFPLKNVRVDGDTIRFMIEVEREDDLFSTPLPAGMETCQFARNLKYPKWKHAVPQKWVFATNKPEYIVVRLKDGNLSVRQGERDTYPKVRIFVYQPSFYVKPQDIDPASW
ncbi:hypothetical protein [uncultured Porphyromonas sp.]|uniref:hypothetical protein n=1 Tax=uncultured Porphyromonas sp. TaxID=159274 RepID=UPI002621D74A|nr:hypothetical protein [uncultured Porphyromonas sp.]